MIQFFFHNPTFWKADFNQAPPALSFGSRTCMRRSFVGSLIMLYNGRDGKGPCDAWLMCVRVIYRRGLSAGPPPRGNRCRFINSPASLPRLARSLAQTKPHTQERKHKEEMSRISGRRIRCRGNVLFRIPRRSILAAEGGKRKESRGWAVTRKSHY